MRSEPSIAARLVAGSPLVLDGATGTELERRGAPCALPLWSARALMRDPGLVEQIHGDYAAAGAEVITANTFRTQRRTLARGDLGGRAAELTALAVELARRGARAASPPAFVVGSAPPLEDCYRPDLVPEQAALCAEHAEHASNLVAAGVDAVLVETMNSIREAVVAARAAVAEGATVLVSFACGPDARLLSGEPLDEALSAAREAGARALLVNCLPPSLVSACLPALRQSGLPFGVYANLGAPLDAAGRERSEPQQPVAFAEHAAAWLSAGARLVGGCCGTGPQHVRALASLRRKSGASGDS